MALLADAPANPPSVGTLVMPKRAEFTLKSATTGKMEYGTPGVLQKSGKIQGSDLLIDHNGLRGWIGADQMISVDAAVSFFSDAIQKDRTNAFLFASRSQAQLGSSESANATNALSDASEALRLNARSPFAHLARGDALADKKGISDAALKAYTEAIQLDPAFAEAYMARGR